MNQAVILAGGEGSRLLPWTAWTPKPLLPVKGVPLLVHVIKKLKLEGWDNIIVCINELHHDQFAYHIEYLQERDFRITLSGHPQSELLGTAGELVTAARFIKSDRFLLHYGDILCNLDTAVLRNEFSGAGTLAVSSQCKLDKGVVELQPDSDLIAKIEEKPTIPKPNLMGIEVLNSLVLEHMEVGEDVHRDVLPRLLEKGYKFRAHLTDEPYLDIGSVDSYRRAQDWVWK